MARALTSLLLALTVATAASAQSPSPSPDPALTATLDAVALMNEAPDGIRETCLPASITEGPSLEGVVAMAQCLVDGGVAVYIRFVDESTLHAGYDMLAAQTGLSPDTGTTCGEGPFEGAYALADGTEGGRLLCQTGPDGPAAMWIERGPRVLGLVQLVGEVEFAALEDAWLGARLDAPGREGEAAATTVPASPTVVAASPGATVSQWAMEAEASSEYGSDSYSARQATGQPDTEAFGDYATAWAPAVQDGATEWVELAYATPVIPTSVTIWETSGNGFVSSVEAYDPASGWVLLWQGEDDSPQAVFGFSPPLASTDTPTDRLRITVDTTVPGWNEIDAVELTGLVPET